MGGTTTEFLQPCQWIAAGTSAIFRQRVLDGSIPQQPVPASALTSLTLSLYDTVTGAIVNNVQNVSILNTGRGTIDSQGNLTITLQPADTALITPLSSFQKRSLVIVWVYNGTADKGSHEIVCGIVALTGDLT